VYSNCCIETLWNLNACLHQVCPTRRMLLLYDSTWPHVFAHHYNHHNIWLAVMQSWPYTVRFSSVWSLERQSVMTYNIMHVVRHCRMFYANGCIGKKATFMWWEYVFLFKGRRNAGNNGDYTGKYLCLQQCCSEIAWNVCIFDLRVTWNKKKRHCLLTNPCVVLNLFMIRNRMFI